MVDGTYGTTRNASPRAWLLYAAFLHVAPCAARLSDASVSYSGDAAAPKAPPWGALAAAAGEGDGPSPAGASARMEGGRPRRARGRGEEGANAGLTELSTGRAPPVGAPPPALAGQDAGAEAGARKRPREEHTEPQPHKRSRPDTEAERASEVTGIGVPRASLLGELCCKDSAEGEADSDGETLEIYQDGYHKLDLSRLKKKARDGSAVFETVAAMLDEGMRHTRVVLVVCERLARRAEPELARDLIIEEANYLNSWNHEQPDDPRCFTDFMGKELKRGETPGLFISNALFISKAILGLVIRIGMFANEFAELKRGVVRTIVEIRRTFAEPLAELIADYADVPTAVLLNRLLKMLTEVQGQLEREHMRDYTFWAFMWRLPLAEILKTWPTACPAIADLAIAVMKTFHASEMDVPDAEMLNAVGAAVNVLAAADSAEKCPRMAVAGDRAAVFVRNFAPRVDLRGFHLQKRRSSCDSAASYTLRWRKSMWRMAVLAMTKLAPRLAQLASRRRLAAEATAQLFARQLEAQPAADLFVEDPYFPAQDLLSWDKPVIGFGPAEWKQLVGQLRKALDEAILDCESRAGRSGEAFPSWQEFMNTLRRARDSVAVD